MNFNTPKKEDKIFGGQQLKFDVLLKDSASPQLRSIKASVANLKKEFQAFSKLTPLDKVKNSAKLVKTSVKEISNVATQTQKTFSRYFSSIQRGFQNVQRAARNTSKAISQIGSVAIAPINGIGNSATRAAGKITQMTTATGLSVGAFGGLKTAVAGLLAGLVAGKIVNYADAWLTTANRLKVVGAEGESLAGTQEKLFRLSQASRSPIEGISSLYGRLAMSTQELNLEQDDLLGLTETISKAFQVSGTSSMEMQNSVIQLGQALASGTLRGDELRSVLEQAPRLARAIADGLGVPFGKIREIAAEGGLTTEKLVGALQSQSSVIRQEFDLMEPTIGSLVTNVDNAIKAMVGKLNEQVKFTEPIKTAIEFIVHILSDRIPAAFSMIPVFMEIMADGFTLIKDIVVNFAKRLLEDPIASLEKVFTYITTGGPKVFTALLRTVIKTFGTIFDVAVETFDFAYQLIIEDANASFRKLLSFFVRLFVNPVMNFFKNIALGLVSAFSFAIPEETKTSLDNFITETNTALKEAFEVEVPPLSDETKTAYDTFIKNTGESLSSLTDEMGGIITELASTLGSDALTTFGATNEQRERILDLFNRLKTAVGDTKTEIDNASEAVNGLASNLEGKEDPILSFWDKLTEKIKASASAVKEEYLKELGTLETNIAEFQKTILESFESGISEGFQQLLFGGANEKAIKQAISDLKTAADGLRRTFPDDIIEGGLDEYGVQTITGILDRVAGESELPQNLRRIATRIRDEFGLREDTPLGIADQIDRLIGKLEDETGFLARIKNFGSSLRSNLVLGFQQATVTLLTQQTMKGLLAISEPVLNEVFSAASTLFSPFQSTVNSLIGGVGTIKDKLVELGRNTFNVTARIAGGALDRIKQIGDSLKGLGGEDGEKSIAVKVNDLASGSLQMIGQTLGQMPSKTVNLTANLVDNATSTITSITQTLANAGNTAYDVFLNLKGDAYNKLLSISGDFAEFGRTVYRSTLDLGGNALDRLISISNRFMAFGQTVYRSSLDLGGTAFAKLESIATKIDDLSGKRFSYVLNQTGTAFAKVSSVFNNVVGLVTGIKDIRINATTVGDKLDSILNLGKNVIEIAVEVMDSGLDFADTLMGTLDKAFSGTGGVGDSLAGAITGATLTMAIGNTFGPQGKLGVAIGSTIGNILVPGVGGAFAGALSGLVLSQLIPKDISNRGAELLEEVLTSFEALGGPIGAFRGVEIGEVRRAKEFEDIRDALSSLDPARVGTGTADKTINVLRTVFGLLEEEASTLFNGLNQVFDPLFSGRIEIEQAGRTFEQVLDSIDRSFFKFAEKVDLNLAGLDFQIRTGELDSQGRERQRFLTVRPDGTLLETLGGRQGAGKTVVPAHSARQGLTIPGPPSREVPVMAHGGERILSVKEQKEMGGNVVNVSFTINGNGDREIQGMLKSAMPQIENSVFNALNRRARFGQMSFDDRAVRTASQI